MKVRFLATAAGPLGAYPVGSTADVAPAWAAALLDAGFAVSAEPPGDQETNMLAAPENAMLRPGKPRRAGR